jgi:MFS family permease
MSEFKVEKYADFGTSDPWVARIMMGLPRLVNAVPAFASRRDAFQTVLGETHEALGMAFNDLREIQRLVQDENVRRPLLTGWLSDHTGRKPLITAGMLVQAAALGLLVAGDGAFAPSLAAALLLGAGTAMVYPTLIAAVSDASQPRDRARVVGVYRFWRDFGFVLGALIAGVGADATSPRTAILIVAALTGSSGLLVATTSWQPRTALRPAPVP